MILAGKTFDVHMADGTTHRVTVHVADEFRFEREHKRSLGRAIDDEGGVYLEVIVGLLHMACRREKLDVPESFDDFADALGDNPFDVVDEGKAAASDQERPTG